MKRLLVLALSIALGLTATACTDSTGPGASLAGTYTLQSVNGSRSAGGGGPEHPVTSEVVPGRSCWTRTGNYQGTTRYRDTYSGAQPVLSDDVITGYWTLSGNQIALTRIATIRMIPTSATVSGNTITLTDYSDRIGGDARVQQVVVTLGETRRRA